MEINVTKEMKKKMFKELVKLIERRGSRRKMVPMINAHNRYHLNPNGSKHETYAILKALQAVYLVKIWRNRQHGVTYIGISGKGWGMVDRARERARARNNG